MPRLELHDPEELDPLRSRYVKLLRHAATAGEPPKPSPMDAALVLCDVLAGREPRIMTRPKAVRAIVDGSGHHRPVYPALLLHAWITACRLRGPAGKAESEAIRDLSNAIFQNIGARNRGWAHLAQDLWDPHPPEPLPAERAPEIVTDVWNNVAAAGYGSLWQWQPRHPSVSWPIHATAVAQQPSGATSVPRAALFHHRETQPDHATSQPWAIHAFLLDPETVPTADLMLLAAGVNQPEGLGAVSRVLLADAAVCLSLRRSDVA